MRPLLGGAITGIALLAAWLGAAILVAAVVAPAAFAVLPTRTLAGALVGRVLPVIFWSGMFVGFAVAALGWPVTDGRASRTMSALLLALFCAVAQLGIAPRIEAVRRSLGVDMSVVDPSDPRRQAFGRLHGLSVACMGVGGLAALVALLLLVRLATRSTP